MNTKTKKTNEKNFTIGPNRLVYVDETVLVRKIFVFNIAANITKMEIEKYFGSFGKLNKVDLIREKHKRLSAPGYAFVLYDDAFAVKRVLTFKEHHLRGRRFYVKAAEVWDQPGNIEDIWGINHIGVAGMTSVDDLCLELILKQLSLADQINMAQSSKKFLDVLLMCSKRLHTNLDLQEFRDMRLSQTRQVLEYIGNNVKAIGGKLPFHNIEHVVLLLRKCPNIQSIDLVAALPTVSLKKCLKDKALLIELHLNGCRITDNGVMVISRLRQLKVLSLSRNRITGRYLERLENLTELDISCCHDLLSSRLITAFAALTELRKLDVQNILMALPYDVLVVNCTELEALKLTPHYSSPIVTTLPHLKNLIISPYPRFEDRYDEFLGHLARNMSGKLESLTIVGSNYVGETQALEIRCLKALKQLEFSNSYKLNNRCLELFSDLPELEDVSIKRCYIITNAGVLTLLSRCKMLKSVNLQGCANITSSFVFDAIDILKYRQYEKTGRIIFYLKGTNVDKRVVEDPRYVSANSFLKLNFEA